jgi:uncharacterized membrane protein YbhN (UPF0104 family)
MNFSRFRKTAGNVVRTLIAAITLFFVFQSVSWLSVLHAYEDADMLKLLAGALLLGGNLWVRTAKWRYMLQALDPKANARDAFWSLLLGISFGAVTPGEVGEFAGRSMHVSGPARAHLVLQAIWVIGAVAGSFLVFLHVDWIRQIAAHVNQKFVKNEWLERVLDGFGCLTPRQRRVTLLYTIGFHLILCAQMYFLLNAFHTVSIVQAVAGTSALMFIKAILPFSIGDLGIRELTAVYLCGWFEVPQADAVNASLLLFVVNIVLPGIIGILALHRHKRVEPKPLK